MFDWTIYLVETFAVVVALQISRQIGNVDYADLEYINNIALLVVFIAVFMPIRISSLRGCWQVQAHTEVNIGDLSFKFFYPHPVAGGATVR